jgi:hypothetical protein
MPRRLLSRSLLGGLVLTALLLAGCGSSLKTVPVKGKLVLPQGLNLGPSDTVQVTFVPVETPASGKAAPQPVAEVNPSDFTFTPTLPKASGIPPGKYKVTVSINGYPTGTPNAKRQEYLDNLNEAFNAKNTKLTCDVAPEGSQSFTVDMNQGTVSKG